MRLLRGVPRHPVDDPPHAGNKVGVIFTDKNNLVPTGLHQMTHEMKVLSGEVLVNKKILQGITCIAMPPRSRTGPVFSNRTFRSF